MGFAEQVAEWGTQVVGDLGRERRKSFKSALQAVERQRRLHARAPAENTDRLGKNDEFFIPMGAEAYRRDLPKAELHYFDTGHLALEEDAPEIARDVRRFFGRGK